MATGVSPDRLGPRAALTLAQRLTVNNGRVQMKRMNFALWSLAMMVQEEAGRNNDHITPVTR